MVEYWHWHTLHFGSETYWGGVLPHSGRPGRTYRNIARIGEELAAAGDLVTDLVPNADVTLVYDRPTKWLMQRHGPLTTADGALDTDSYRGLFDPFHRGAFDAGLQARIVHARGLADEPPKEAVGSHPVLVVPGLYLADDRTLDWLRSYAQAGGHLVLGPRTAYGDAEARARTEVAPARLAESAGAWYEEFNSLNEDMPVVAKDPGFALDDTAAATRWVDGLTVDDATVLAGYDHPHFGRWAAVTTREAGEGRITCVGTLPNRSFAAALMSWVCPEDRTSLQDLPATVTAASARTRDGCRLHFLHNWSWEPTTVRLPLALADVIGSDTYEAGDELELGPWDVRVLRSQL